MLTLAKNTIFGSVMGRPVHAFTLDGGADAAPLPGEYGLLPPLDDPVFGTYIIAVPRSAGYKPAYDWRKLSTEPGTAPSHEGIKLSIANGDKFVKRTGATTEAGFVLSKQAIPGRNCVVLVSGFSDLLDALSDAADAALTVI